MRNGISFIIPAGHGQRLRGIAAQEELWSKLGDGADQAAEADPDDIIAARNRGFQKLESIH